MIVLDASAAIELLLNTSEGAAVAARLSSDTTIHAPQLLTVEVAQVLRRFTANDVISSRRAGQALDDLADLGIDYCDHDVLVRRIWQLKANLTAYDAAYIALAEALDAPVLTFDRRMAAAPGNRAQVQLLG